MDRRIVERRQDNPKISPLIERRGGTERRAPEPRWMTWARENRAAKDLGAGRAA